VSCMRRNIEFLLRGIEEEGDCRTVDTAWKGFRRGFDDGHDDDVAFDMLIGTVVLCLKSGHLCLTGIGRISRNPSDPVPRPCFAGPSTPSARHVMHKSSRPLQATEIYSKSEWKKQRY